MSPPIEWWAISARADDRTAALAADFCTYLLTDPVNAEAMTIEHGVPVVPGLRERARSGASAAVRETFDAFDTVRASGSAPVRPQPPGAGELLTQVLGTLNEDVGFARTTAGAATEAFFTESARILG